MLCGDVLYYSNGIIPLRTDTQRRASARLSRLLEGQEERYPILIVDDALAYHGDLNNIPLAQPAPLHKGRIPVIYPATST